MKKFILAIDQGTTSTRACLVSERGEIVSSGQKIFPQHFPRSGWVEHSLDEIWQSVVGSIQECLVQSKIKHSQILSIGITNQRETVGMWDAETLESLSPAIVWQCRRTQEICEKLKKKKKESWLQKKTGLLWDPYFSGTKIKWLLDENPSLRRKAIQGKLRCGTMDSYLVQKLTQGTSHCTDVTNASRTLLMNLKRGEWDNEILKFLDIPSNILPRIVSTSSSEIGFTQGLGFLPDGIPITALVGDQQAALFGQGCHRPGDAKCTFGTGSFILLNTGQEPIFSKNRMLTTVAWKIHNRKIVYALEGGAFVCGSAVQWLRDGLGIINKSSDVESLARTVSTTEGVEFIPALTGLGAPYWRPEARGVITGLSRGATKAHLARATLEAMALQNGDILKAMELDFGKKTRQLKVDGGATANNLLLQMQADFLGIPVVRPQILEATILGAAILSGLGVGLWKSSKDVLSFNGADLELKPTWSVQKRKDRWNSWHKNVEKA